MLEFCWFWFMTLRAHSCVLHHVFVFFFLFSLFIDHKTRVCFIIQTQCCSVIKARTRSDIIVLNEEFYTSASFTASWIKFFSYNAILIIVFFFVTFVLQARHRFSSRRPVWFLIIHCNLDFSIFGAEEHRTFTSTDVQWNLSMLVCSPREAKMQKKAGCNYFLLDSLYQSFRYLSFFLNSPHNIYVRTSGIISAFFLIVYPTLSVPIWTDTTRYALERSYVCNDSTYFINSITVGQNSRYYA